MLEHAPRPGRRRRRRTGTLPGFVHDGTAPRSADDGRVAGDARAGARGRVGRSPDVVIAHPFPDGSAIALHRDVAETARSLGPAGAGWAAAMERLLPRAQTAGRGRSCRRCRRCGAGCGWRWRCAATGWSGRGGWPGRSRRSGWMCSTATGGDRLAGGLGAALRAAADGRGERRVRAAAAAARATATAGRCRAAGCGRWPTRWSPRRAPGARSAATRRSPRCSCGRPRGRACGSRTARRSAPTRCASTVSAGVLARLLPAGALPGRLHRRLRIWRYGTAPFKLDYALSARSPWTASEPRSAGVVHVAGALQELTRAADDAQRGEVPERPALVVGQQSLHDPTRAPAGSTRCTSTAHVPARYDEPDDAVAERIEAQLERFAPGFASLVLRTARCGAGADRAREPEPGRRRPRRRLLRARPAARLPSLAAPVPLPHAAARPLRRGRVRRIPAARSTA